MREPLTEENILAGSAVITVEKRDGSTVEVPCKPLSWAASCKVMSDPDRGQAMLLAVLSGVPRELATDDFLNQLTPDSLSDIAATVLELTHGVPALKKQRAARNLNAQPAMPTSTPPPANCANPVTAAPSALASAPPN
jgi:hypothetical protein